MKTSWVFDIANGAVGTPCLVRGTVRGMPVAFMREKHNGGLKSGQLLGHFIHGHHTGGERWEQAQPETELITGGAEFTLAFRTPFGSTAQRDRQHPDFERAFFAQPQREQARDGFVVRMRCQHQYSLFHHDSVSLLAVAAKPIPSYFRFSPLL